MGGPVALTIEDVAGKTQEYLPAEKVSLVREAYEFAEEAHRGQRRATGGPYIEHPLEVAYVLTGLQLDASTIAGALLHDVIEDCGRSREEIERRFGPDVYKLVDGVTKLSRIPTSSPGGRASPAAGLPAARAESLRKMLVAMAEDVRVILIKLADRLHNMRTIDPLSPEKQARIAKETLDVYAPLAHRLGISSFQWQLEDLAFRTLQPEDYKEISHLLAQSRERREALIANVVSVLKDELSTVGIEAAVSGRAKHIYSIYKKKQRYSGVGRAFDQIHDLVAVRVLVDDIPSCYAALGVVHNLWHPIRGEFDDYIASPRENMYQSLHTAVFGPAVMPLEVQIRTTRMHELAEYGVAAHWRYKEGGPSDGRFDDQMNWMRQLLEWHQEEPAAEAFVESVQTDIFPDLVFVYTPKGEVREMPAGATAIDLAYLIHTDLGHSCGGAKVNGKLVSLDYQLQNGDTVEVVARNRKGPSLDWLNQDMGYVRTANARTKIKQWFRRQARHENIERGKDMLEKELRHLRIDMSELEAAKTLEYDSLDDLLLALGSGALSVHQLGHRLLPPTPEPEALPLKPTPVPVDGNQSMTVMGQTGLHVRLAACCSPVVGDLISGFVTRSRGVTVHRKDCRSFREDDSPERIVEVEWGTPSRYYEAKVAIEAMDRVGLLRDIASLVSSERVNIAAVRSTHHKNGRVTEYLTLHTSGTGQLRRLLSKFEGVTGVVRVDREG